MKKRYHKFFRPHACKLFWETGKWKPLSRYLTKHPGIFKRARIINTEIKLAEKEEPFRRHYYRDKVHSLNMRTLK